MKKTYLAFLVLALFSVSIFTSCKPGDDDNTPPNPLIGTWTVGAGTTVEEIDGSGNATVVTNDWSSYSLTFTNGTSYTLTTQDNSGNFSPTSGNYNAGNEGSNINFTSGNPFIPETIIGYTYSNNNANLSFTQDVDLAKGAITLRFTNLVKQ